jgi:hypothetical protein
MCTMPLSTLPRCKRVPCPYSEVLPLSSCPTGRVYTSHPGLTAEFPHTHNRPFHHCSRASAFSDVRGTSSEEFDIPSCNSELPSSRPYDPSSNNYDNSVSKIEFLLAKNLQKHKCGLGCIKVMKGQVICKRCVAFPISKLSWIDAEGKWRPQWFHPWLNNWNPTTLLCTRSNIDVKLITNGGETKEYSWYITSYMAKKQHNTSNASTLLAKAVAFHWRHEWYTSDIDLLNKCLIQCCANTLSREQEFSTPEVISYLMGWGDRYVSHQTETIYFSSIVSLLKCQYPALKNQKWACCLLLGIKLMINIGKQTVVVEWLWRTHSKNALMREMQKKYVSPFN